ncbi:BamA/TamA family outer membrane protein [Prevotella sp. 10(H)]|uniref:translocation and assembly module lipoprotein TamL n=1 Tax=Prevotella sp. 10(H) TaxID=1158294 RepID=UPI0004A74725|nr:BamA/TamA family outer membrane protein [Prevotella sp. 10(H)]
MKKITLISLILILAACNTTKNIPEGQYLLDDIKIKHDTKNATSDLKDFVRQQPNSSVPLLGKVRLGIYNMAGQDTSKWINRTVRKLGQAPVIYSATQTAISENQLKKELNNQGYLNAEVDTTLEIKDKKIKVTYTIDGGIPYLIRDYKYDITTDTTMKRIMGLIPFEPILKKGDMFDMSMLEEERLRINNIMRNVGFSTFSKEYVYFKADTTLNSHQVDLYMDIYPPKDSLRYPRYKINKVTVVSGINSINIDRNQDGQMNTNRWFFRNADTTQYRDLTIVRGRNKFLRNSSIARNNYLKKGGYYSDYNITRTYEAYSKMAAIKQVNIATSPSPEDSTKLLDATIILLPANAHWFKAGLDGTNSAGDIGVAPSISYQHQNLFNGGEQLSIRLKGAYEFIAGSKSTDLLNSNYYEYGIETSLTFPQFLFPWLKKSWREQPLATTRFTLGLNNQHRSEYTRQFFNMGVAYGWNSKRNRLSHSLDLLDINYIRMPWVSDYFRQNYLDSTNNVVLRESYSDKLVARTAYTITYVNGRRLTSLYPTFTLRGSVEVAGALPRLATTIGKASENELGEKKILGVAYAEYVKGSIDYARTFYFSKRHSLAYHMGLGLAHPYGNSSVLPFERRFFSGGANSVRGWSTRSLGPGAYKRLGSGDFVNQAGDMKLEFNIENRLKLSDLFEFAQFIDAGNIWTLKNYEEQPGGQFKFRSFYKELGVSYGIGLRLDLNFLLLRFDTGMKAYDPGRDQSKRFILFKPRLNNMAFHFGIGYPF